jgi:hypothetical protein
VGTFALSGTLYLVGSLVLLVAFLAATPSPHNSLDPAFDKVPFDQWLAEHESKGPFHWTLNVPRAVLTFHQRLQTRIEIKLDGRDLETRRAAGRVAFLLQITDRDGTKYQRHRAIDLGKLDENIGAANIEYLQGAFLLPGEYRLAIAVVDLRTGEHNTREAQFRVPRENHGFLEEAWRGLPPVEFTGKEDSPDSWFLPEVEGRLQWAAAVREPARIDVILNVAAHRTSATDLAALLPTLKALSQTGSSGIAEHVELLDLSRRRVAFDQAFDQKDAADIDWPRLKESLGESNTASIDVHSLSESRLDAQFFVSQVRSVLRDSQQPCVLVVLTPPVAFERDEDLNPISVEALPACRVVYARYHAVVERTRPVDPMFGGHGRGRGDMGPPVYAHRTLQVVDQLEATLKPLNPKVFDVDTPEQMTRVLVEIEKMLH